MVIGVSGCFVALMLVEMTAVGGRCLGYCLLQAEEMCDVLCVSALFSFFSHLTLDGFVVVYDQFGVSRSACRALIVRASQS